MPKKIALNVNYAELLHVLKFVSKVIKKKSHYPYNYASMKVTSNKLEVISTDGKFIWLGGNLEIHHNHLYGDQYSLFPMIPPNKEQQDIDLKYLISPSDLAKKLSNLSGKNKYVDIYLQYPISIRGKDKEVFFNCCEPDSYPEKPMINSPEVQFLTVLSLFTEGHKYLSNCYISEKDAYVDDGKYPAVYDNYLLHKIGNNLRLVATNKEVLGIFNLRDEALTEVPDFSVVLPVSFVKLLSSLKRDIIQISLGQDYFKITSLDNKLWALLGSYRDNYAQMKGYQQITLGEQYPDYASLINAIQEKEPEMIAFLKREDLMKILQMDDLKDEPIFEVIYDKDNSRINLQIFEGDDTFYLPAKIFVQDLSLIGETYVLSIDALRRALAKIKSDDIKIEHYVSEELLVIQPLPMENANLSLKYLMKLEKKEGNYA